MLYKLTFYDYLPWDKLLNLSNSYDSFNKEYSDCNIENGIDYIKRSIKGLV